MLQAVLNALGTFYFPFIDLEYRYVCPVREKMFCLH